MTQKIAIEDTYQKPPIRSVLTKSGGHCMDMIELLAKLQANRRELSEMEEKIIMIKKEIAMTTKEIVDLCKTTENYEVVLGSSLRNGITQIVKNAKYVSMFSPRLFANPDFAELVRGRRYGLFMSDSDFAPVVKFVGFDLSDYPDEYEKGRKTAKAIAKQREIIVVFDKEVLFGKMD